MLDTLGSESNFGVRSILCDAPQQYAAVAKTNVSALTVSLASLEQIREAFFDLDDALYNEESRILEYGSPLVDYFNPATVLESFGDRYRNGIRRLT